MRDDSLDIGVIWGVHSPDNCSCHISPPCHACTSEDRDYIQETCKVEEITDEYERYVPYSELARLEKRVSSLTPVNEEALLDCIKRIVVTRTEISSILDNMFEHLSKEDLLKYQRKIAICNSLRNEFCRIFGEDTIDNIENSFKDEMVNLREQYKKAI